MRKIFFFLWGLTLLDITSPKNIYREMLAETSINTNSKSISLSVDEFSEDYPIIVSRLFLDHKEEEESIFCNISQPKINLTIESQYLISPDNQLLDLFLFSNLIIAIQNDMSIEIFQIYEEIDSRFLLKSIDKIFSTVSGKKYNRAEFLQLDNETYAQIWNEDWIYEFEMIEGQLKITGILGSEFFWPWKKKIHFGNYIYLLSETNTLKKVKVIPGSRGAMLDEWNLKIFGDKIQDFDIKNDNIFFVDEKSGLTITDLALKKKYNIKISGAKRIISFDDYLFVGVKIDEENIKFQKYYFSNKDQPDFLYELSNSGLWNSSLSIDKNRIFWINHKKYLEFSFHNVPLGFYDLFPVFLSEKKNQNFVKSYIYNHSSQNFLIVLGTEFLNLYSFQKNQLKIYCKLNEDSKEASLGSFGLKSYFISSDCSKKERIGDKNRNSYCVYEKNIKVNGYQFEEKVELKFYKSTLFIIFLALLSYFLRTFIYLFKNRKSNGNIITRKNRILFPNEELAAINAN